MQSDELLQLLREPPANTAACALKVITRRGLVDTLLAGINDPQARVRFTSARVLEHIAQWSPEILYPHFSFFARLLNSDNRIMQWEAIRILAHLVPVDKAHWFDKLFRRFFTPICGPVMITAATIIGCAPVIASARPIWADRIARQVLNVEQGRYQTAECRNVAIGQAIKACHRLLPLLKRPQPVLAFVRRQAHNPRPATRKKAARFIANCQGPRTKAQL